MKEFVQNRIVSSFIFIVMITGVLILADIGSGRDIHLPTIIISGFCILILKVLFETLGNYSVFSRIKYLKSNDIVKPFFKCASSSETVLSQTVNFSRLKSEISSNWLVTFSDDTNHVIKFRQKTNCFTDTWGVAAWLKLDVDVKTLHLECFPLSGIAVESAIMMRMELEDLFETLQNEQT